jgi:hypothetical protein
MAHGAFVDKTHKPTLEELPEVLGAKRPLWDDLDRFVADNFSAKSNFAFYGKNYGWAMRYKRAGKALLSMYPGKDSFTAQIVLAEAEAKRVFTSDLGANAKKAIEDAHSFPEGRWLFIKVESEKDLKDIKKLIFIKTGKKE